MQKSTDREWPKITLDLIRGAPALKFEIDLCKDSDRLRILISMAVWAIWKSRNRSAILDRNTSTTETAETFKELIQDQIRKSWNATRFLEGKRKELQRRAIKATWAEGSLTDFNRKTGPIMTLT